MEQQKQNSEPMELNEDEINNIADDAGIDKKYVEKSLELERADKKFRKYDYKKESKKIDFDKKISGLNNFVLFCRKVIFSTPTNPNFAKVRSINAPKNEDVIILNLTADYPSIPDDDKNKLEKSIKLDLSKDDDLRTMKYILNHTEVAKPSKLKNKSIPIRPINTTNYASKTDKVSYRIDTPPKSVFRKLPHKLNRFLLWSYSFERKSSFEGLNRKGKIGYSKNIYLIISLFLLPILYINYTLASILLIFTLFPYLLLIIIGLFMGILEFIFKKPDNRDYVNRKMNS